MSKSFLFLSILWFSSILLHAQKEPKPFVIYDSKGNETSFIAMANALNKAEVVLFGEQHDNSIVHWLQLELTNNFYTKRKSKLILGAEMFETDNQLIVDEYLNGFIKHKHLKNEAKVWKNHETDYRPLLDFARSHELRFVATNVPRRYASIVARKGIEKLSELPEQARLYMVPLPFKVDTATPGYQEIHQMQHGMEMSSDNFVNAQALKDATMAHFIASNYKKGELFLHFNGDFHSKSYGGIYWYLLAQNATMKVMIISSITAEKLEFDSEYEGRADFIIITPENITKTY